MSAAPPASLAEIGRLATLMVLVTFVQAIAQTAEAALIGRLGTEALAGYALVLPLLMLLQMTSTGAMGGGQAQYLMAFVQRHQAAGGVLVVGDRIKELWAVADEMIFQ